MNAKKIIFFDGVCNLCNSTVQFLIKHNKSNTLHFASLQSDLGQKFLKENCLKIENFETIYYLKNKKIYSHSSAILEIFKELNGFYPYLSILKIVPKFIRDAVYCMVSKNRYRWFGKKESCWLPTTELKEKFLD